MVLWRSWVRFITWIRFTLYEIHAVLLNHNIQSYQIPSCCTIYDHWKPQPSQQTLTCINNVMYRCRGPLHIKGYTQTTILYQNPALALERVGLVMHLLKYDHNVPNYLDADNSYWGLFPHWWSSQGLKLTTHLHLVPEFRMSGATSHLPICLHSMHKDSFTGLKAGFSNRNGPSVTVFGTRPVTEIHKSWTPSHLWN